MLIIEFDGLQHLRDREQWSHDLLRREQLEAAGWRIIVINSDQLTGDPSGTLGRIRSAMIDRGSGPLRTRPPIWIRTFVYVRGPLIEKSSSVDFRLKRARAGKSRLVEFFGGRGIAQRGRSRASRLERGADAAYADHVGVAGDTGG